MLENLDQIDWKTLHHAYGSAIDTPAYIRKLLSTDENERHAAHEHLVGAVAHQGDVSSATVAVVPFIIEILGDNTTPQRAWLVSYLKALCDTCNEHLLGLQFSLREPSFGDFRYQMDTYSNVCKGIDTYVVLLDHPDLRLPAIRLIGVLPDQSELTFNPLWRAIQGETHPDSLILMLQSFTTVAASYWLQNSVDNRILDILEDFALHYTDQRVRLAAADSIVTIVQRIDDYNTRAARMTPSIITVILDYAIQQERDAGNHFLVPSELPHGITHLRLEKLTPLLAYSELLPKTAHLLVREILDRLFVNTRGKHSKTRMRRWQDYEKNTDVPLFNGTYTLPQDFWSYQFYRPTHPFSGQQREILEQIIACESFWRQETNLFSFFFGLPDDREHLRQLVSQG